MAIEVQRMQRVILEQKGLRRDVLEKQREPVMRLRQEAQAKKRKIREILSLQDKIFEEAVAFLFPVQYPEEEEPVLPPLRPPKPERRLTIDEFVKLEIALRKEVSTGGIDRFRIVPDQFRLLQRCALRDAAASFFAD